MLSVDNVVLAAGEKADAVLVDDEEITTSRTTRSTTTATPRKQLLAGAVGETWLLFVLLRGRLMIACRSAVVSTMTGVFL